MVEKSVNMMALHLAKHLEQQKDNKLEYYSDEKMECKLDNQSVGCLVLRLVDPKVAQKALQKACLLDFHLDELLEYNLDEQKVDQKVSKTDD